MRPEIKICGIKFNAKEVAALGPSYMGFIFHPSSPRSVHEHVPTFPSQSIKRVGVFVNRPMSYVEEMRRQHGLDVIQLHGDESPDYCATLNEQSKVWKVFSVDNGFDLATTEPYAEVVRRFLFDTKGDYRGGNGVPFDWTLLKDYPYSTDFVISGGIGPESVADIKNLMTQTERLVAVDLNSRFETEPGLKNINSLNEFMHELSR